MKEIQENHKAIKTAKKPNWFGLLKFKTKTQNFNTDDTKILFNHCLLHLTSLRGLGENMNAKTAFKT